MPLPGISICTSSLPTFRSSSFALSLPALVAACARADLWKAREELAALRKKAGVDDVEALRSALADASKQIDKLQSALSAATGAADESAAAAAGHERTIKALQAQVAAEKASIAGLHGAIEDREQVRLRPSSSPAPLTPSSVCRPVAMMNPRTHPNAFFHRPHYASVCPPADVARTTGRAEPPEPRGAIP